MAYIKSRKHGAATQPRPHYPSAGALAAAAALALPGALYAQQAPTAPPAPKTPSDTALPEVKVKATAENEQKVETLASPKYTAPLRDLPQTITVLPARVLEQQNRVSLVEALATVPGITFGAGEGGGGYGDSINFRGYSANNNITIDGMRDSAQYNRSDAFNFEQIEVTNGANSVYGGAGNVSGGINLVSKSPKGENFTRLSGTLGSDKYGRATVDTNYLLNDTTAVRFNAMAHNNDVPGRDVEKFKRFGFAPSITFGLNTPTQVTLSYLHQHDNNIPQYGVPYYKNAFNDGPVPGVKPSNYYGYSNIDKQRIDVDVFTAVFEHRFDDTFKVRNQSRGERIEQLSRVNPPQGLSVPVVDPVTGLPVNTNVGFCLADGTNVATGQPCLPGFDTPNTYYPGGPRGNNRLTTNTFLANQTDFTKVLRTGSIEHTLVAGFSLSHESFKLDTGNSLRNPGGTLPNPALPPMDITNPDHVYAGPVNYIRTGRTTGEVDNVAAYVFDNLKFNDQWALNGGVRLERNRGNSASTSLITPDGVETWNPQTNNNDTLFSYRLGVVYKPVENGTFYIAYGNSETPSKASVNGSCTQVTPVPGTPAANNCNVAPETAANIEVGTKWDLLDNRLSLTAAVFRNELKNYRVASNDPVLPDQQLDGKSRVDGVALGAAGQITPLWGVTANYTYLDSKVLSNASGFCNDNPTLPACATALAVEGNPLTNTPKHAFSLWTTYQVIPSLTLGYGVLYQGSWYLTNGAAPLYKAPDYWVQNAMASFKATRNLELQLNVKNLADKTYYTRIRNNGWATPGDGRAFTLTANYAF